MIIHEFQIILADKVEATEELADRLYKAGCDDGTLFSSDGVTAIGLSREAASLQEAVRSAISDVTSAGQRAERVEPGDEPTYSRINAELSE